MNRRLRKMAWVLAAAGVCLTIGACAVLNQKKFGAQPGEERRRSFLHSPNYAEGGFRNAVPTPTLAEGQSMIKILWEGLFSKPERLRPQEPLPVAKTDLATLDADRDVMVWLGHSSYFIQLGGKRILVDPVFSDHGAPFSFMNKTFPGTNLYTASETPEIDFLLITHDHWDHLDHQTVVDLRPKVKTAVVPLGVGAHLERWGYPKEKIQEADWNAALRFENGFAVHVVPARHYSGRSLTRNKTLWAGFVLESPERRIFLSGDSGYGPHLREIARVFGSFDLAAIDGGQYDSRWPLIHMTPEEAVKAAEELNAESLLLSHAGKFAIAAHAWDEPFIRAVEAVKDKKVRLVSPKIGEPLPLDGAERAFPRWWESVPR